MKSDVKVRNLGGQTPEPTNRNHIVGRTGTDECVIQHKVQAARIPCGKCGGYMGGKLLLLPGEILQTESRGESESRSNNELQEVSRVHITLCVFFKGRAERS